jgi:hypothetical protein
MHSHKLGKTRTCACLKIFALLCIKDITRTPLDAWTHHKSLLWISRTSGFSAMLLSTDEEWRVNTPFVSDTTMNFREHRKMKKVMHHLEYVEDWVLQRYYNDVHVVVLELLDRSTRRHMYKIAIHKVFHAEHAERSICIHAMLRLRNCSCAR